MLKELLETSKKVWVFRKTKVECIQYSARAKKLLCHPSLESLYLWALLCRQHPKRNLFHCMSWSTIAYALVTLIHSVSLTFTNRQLLPQTFTSDIRLKQIYEGALEQFWYDLCLSKRYFSFLSVGMFHSCTQCLCANRSKNSVIL